MSHTKDARVTWGKPCPQKTCFITVRTAKTRISIFSLLLYPSCNILNYNMRNLTNLASFDRSAEVQTETSEMLNIRVFIVSRFQAGNKATDKMPALEG